MKTLRSQFVTVVCLVLVSGCASSPRSDQSGALQAKSNSDFLAYKNCMESAANYYAPSTATPHEIADAAQAKCGAEYYSYERSTENYFISIVSSSGVSMARGKSRTLTQEMKGVVKEKVVQWVVDARLRKK